LAPGLVQGVRTAERAGAGREHPAASSRSTGTTVLAVFLQDRHQLRRNRIFLGRPFDRGDGSDTPPKLTAPNAQNARLTIEIFPTQCRSVTETQTRERECCRQRVMLGEAAPHFPEKASELIRQQSIGLRTFL